MDTLDICTYSYDFVSFHGYKNDLFGVVFKSCDLQLGEEATTFIKL